ncbi:unnamed protein product [Moneuplotes crassus]|uniref:BRCT domain-containing protein n=1 Tax=Euplotes crassus TaxID=5936 RepID=A0AAD1UUM3_EUPCR|nr:unnamed protein product [Moneuplotes crassus]
MKKPTQKLALFQYKVPGLKNPLQYQFYFGESFKYQNQLVELIRKHGGAVLTDDLFVNCLTIQITCQDRRREELNYRQEPLFDEEFKKLFSLKDKEEDIQSDIWLINQAKHSDSYYEQKFYNGPLYSINWIKESLLRGKIQNQEKYFVKQVYQSLRTKIEEENLTIKNLASYSPNQVLFIFQYVYWRSMKSFDLEQDRGVLESQQKPSILLATLYSALGNKSLKSIYYFLFNNKIGKIPFEEALTSYMKRRNWTYLKQDEFTHNITVCKTREMLLKENPKTQLQKFKTSLKKRGKRKEKDMLPYISSPNPSSKKPKLCSLLTPSST